MNETILQSKNILLSSDASSKDEAIEQIAALMAACDIAPIEYGTSLLKRENVSNTFLGHGVAIPHGMPEDRSLIRQTGIVVLQSPAGLTWNPGETVHLVVGIAARSDEHLAILRRLTRMMQDEALMQQLFHTGDAEQILQALNASPGVSQPAPEPAHDLPWRQTWQLDYPNGLHARPASVWVNTAKQYAARLQIRHGHEVADARHLVGLLQLGLQQGDILTLSADGSDAEQALDGLFACMQSLSQSEKASAELAKAKARAAASPLFTPEAGLDSLQGIGASPGLAIGITRRWQTRQHQVEDVPGSLAEGGQRLEDALQQARQALQTLADDTQARLGAEAAQIFHAQNTLLSDGELIGHCCRLMAAGHGVAWSWQQAVEESASRLQDNPNPLLAARAADLRDAGRSVLDLLLPGQTSGHRLNPAEKVILLAEDLAPSDTARLDPANILGLCTARGGPTSHTAILARTLGLPALVGAGDDLLQIADGTQVILDGQQGALYLNPGKQALQQAQESMARQRQALQSAQQSAGLPAQTLDGHRLGIQANINRDDQAAGALQSGAEGVGLMRTELLFVERDHAPEEEEQYQAYRAMLSALDGKPLVVRTLDIGGDKQAPWLTLPAEDNPFLGVRGARLLLQRPDLLDTQMRALYRAAIHGPLSVMFPMITSVAELQQLRQRCEAIRQSLQAPTIPLGIMIEVPAAAVLADKLALHADFFSIGTNDLTQYVLAMDRQHPQLAAQADALHPAVLRLIRQTVEGAHSNGIDVSVCGGLAGDPDGATILAGLGVDKLSMSPSDIPAVKARLRASRKDGLQALAERALACDNAADVRRLCGESA
ncbi:phosphoenolpyruvate--protein phosphotransferase [Paludibacterium sp. THUN1379]|uniref:phosphoenolpyruvate--protein phosphotransferase n=1 Tax=Paludibacterium sp. THUN1379 TaxID=3112107 RepID=UPI00308FA04F|nr:phosphoenolpyruvate--protein phosphotransferase [Paludibacterium sp. THUN1379]